MDTTPDNHYLLITGNHGFLRVFDLQKILHGSMEKPVATLESKRSMVDGLAFSPDDTELLVSHEKFHSQVFNVHDHTLRGKLNSASRTTSFKFSHDGSVLATFSDNSFWRYPSLEKINALNLNDVRGRFLSDDGALPLLTLSELGLGMMLPPSHGST
jgi:WD40 repeat protein